MDTVQTKPHFSLPSIIAVAAAIASTPGNYVIQIDNEQMLVTNVNVAANTLTVQRGYGGTTAAAHGRVACISKATVTELTCERQVTARMAVWQSRLSPI